MTTKINLDPEGDSIDALRIIKTIELDYAMDPLKTRHEISIQDTVSKHGSGFLIEVGAHEGAIILCQRDNHLTMEWINLPDQNGQPQNRIERLPVDHHRPIADLLRGDLDQACKLLDEQEQLVPAYDIPDVVHAILQNFVENEPLANPVWCPTVFTIASVCDGRKLDLIVLSQEFGTLDAGSITWFPVAGESGEISLTFDTATEWSSEIGEPESLSFNPGDFVLIAQTIHAHLQKFTRAVHRKKLATWLGMRPSSRRHPRYQLVY